MKNKSLYREGILIFGARTDLWRTLISSTKWRLRWKIKANQYEYLLSSFNLPTLQTSHVSKEIKKLSRININNIYLILLIAFSYSFALFCYNINCILSVVLTEVSDKLVWDKYFFFVSILFSLSRTQRMQSKTEFKISPKQGFLKAIFYFLEKFEDEQYEWNMMNNLIQSQHCPGFTPPTKKLL